MTLAFCLTGEPLLAALSSAAVLAQAAGGAADLPSATDHFLRVLPRLWEGAIITVRIAFFAEVIGIVLGLTLAVGRLYGPWWIRWLVLGYVDVMRGTPMLVQILFLYFGLPALISSLSDQAFSFQAEVAGVLALGLNSGAYLSEIFRSAITSIDHGQSEAARSLGMTAPQNFRFVVAPQALFRALPPMGNEFITLLKDTSLLSVIAVTEIVKVGQLYAARTYAVFPTYLAIGVTYFVLVFTISRLLMLLERRMEAAHR